jgi:hypothetical protein
MFVAGVGFSLVGLGEAIYFPHFRSHALRTNGVITNLVREEDKGNTYYCPEFAFQTADGLGHKVTSTNCPNISEFSAGQTVPVLYKPNDPSDAYIDSTGQFGGVASGDFKIGVVSLFIAVPLFWFARRRGIPIKWLDGWSA